MPTQKIKHYASQSTFESFIEFKEIEEMNETVRKYRDTIKQEINRSDLRSKLLTLLEVLKRHSCKYFGVSFLRKNKIAEIMGVTRRSVITYCKRLQDMGIIKQVETKRKTDNNQTTNLIIIQPIETKTDNSSPKIDDVSHNEPEKSEETFTPKKTTTSFKTNNIKEYKERKDDQNFDYDLVARYVPKEFIDRIKSVDDEPKAIEEYWKCVFLQNIHTKYDEPKVLKIASNAIKQLRSGYKYLKHRNIEVKNMFGFFTGIVKKKFDEQLFQDIHELSETDGLFEDEKNCEDESEKMFLPLNSNQSSILSYNWL